LLDTQAKLTAEIHNLTNGLNQLIDLSKMMMKSHIENVNTMDDLKQYLKQSINILYNKVERIKDPLIKEISEQSNKIVTAQEAINKKILDRQTVLAGALTFMVRGLKSHEVIDHDYKQSAINQLTKI
jgi:phage-related baseplate assembly protein